MELSKFRGGGVRYDVLVHGVTCTYTCTRDVLSSDKNQENAVEICIINIYVHVQVVLMVHLYNI